LDQWGGPETRNRQKKPGGGNKNLEKKKKARLFRAGRGREICLLLRDGSSMPEGEKVLPRSKKRGGLARTTKRGGKAPKNFG